MRFQTIGHGLLLLSVTNGLTISIPKTEVVVFGGGHQQCQWHVGGHRLNLRPSSVVNLSFIWGHAVS